MAGKYHAGGFALPASTGNFSVTGLGFQDGCQGVIFFGSNQDAEDTVVTDVNAGAFMGIMGQSSGGIQAQANCVLPGQGQQSSGDQPILMLSVFDTIEYVADWVSLDVDGFTIDFTTVVAADRWIHYLAWGDFTNADALRVTGSNTSTTATLDWYVRAMVMAGCLSYSSVPGIGGDWYRPDLPGFQFAWWCGASYPDSGVSGTWKASQMSTVRSPPYGQGFQKLTYTQESSPHVAWGAFYIGPFLGQAIHRAHPIGTTQFIGAVAGFNSSDLFLLWDGDTDCNEGTPSGTGGGTSVQILGGPVVIPEAILLFGICGRDSSFGTGSPQSAVGFGVKTDTYEGCVMVNETGQYLFQSRQRSWCSDADAGGVNAGTITLGSGDFTMVTAEDTAAAKPMAWTAFGPGIDDYLPQIYRWLKK